MDRVTEEKILEAYKKVKQIKKLEIIFNLSYYKISKVLRKYGINARKKGKRLKPRFYNCISKWLYEHPGVILPRKPREIQALIGCSSDSIRTFLYRKRRAIKDYIRNIRTLNPLRELGSFKDIHGRTLTYPMVEEFYPIQSDVLNGDVLIRIKLKAVNNKYYYVRLNVKEFIK